MSGRLVIGSRRYSSWSLRGWLAVAAASLDVTVEIIPLTAAPTGALARATETGLVPFLEHDGSRVWESLAIVEYCAETAPLWPAGRAARAHARSLASEMHGGFAGLRQAMPMNLGRPDFAGRGRNPAALADIARIERAWAAALAAHGGRFLFGDTLGGADIMFAPVVARFLTYAPELTAASRDYCDAVRAHRLVDAWYEAAAAEPEAWRLDRYETLA